MKTTRPDVKQLDATKKRTLVKITARSYFREMIEYGFGRNDVIDFTTDILDLLLKREAAPRPRRVVESVTFPVRYEKDESGAVVSVVGPNLRLRAIRDDDVTLFERWATSGAHRGTLIERILDRDVGEILEHFSEPANTLFVAHLIEGGAPVGFVTFERKWSDPSRAGMQKFLGDTQVRGRGFGTQMTYLWVHYGFTHLGLRKISAKTVDSNLVNINLNRKLGFRFEGHLTQEAQVSDGFVDLTVMGVLRDRFLKMIELTEGRGAGSDK